MPLLILAFAGSFGLIFSAGLLIFHRDSVRNRLAEIIASRIDASSRLARLVETRPGPIEQIVKPFQNILPRTAKEVSVLQKRLIRAGYRQESAVSVFYGAKVAAPLLLLFLVFVTGLYRYSLFLQIIVAGLIGFMAPDFG